MAQWLRICLPVWGTRVLSLVWEDFTSCGTTKAREPQLLSLCYRACALQQKKPPQWEAQAPQLEKAQAKQRPRATKNKWITKQIKKKKNCKVRLESYIFLYKARTAYVVCSIQPYLTYCSIISFIWVLYTLESIYY